MKKTLLYLFPALFLALLPGIQHTSAQEEKSSKVHITITEGGEVSTDTTFELDGGQDPEMIKKMIEHLAGGDMHAKHMSHDVYVSHSGDKKMVWIGGDDDECLHSKHMMSDINIDSIREAHGDAKILVIKKKNGKITVKELENEHELHMDDDLHGEHHEMVFIESEEDGEVVHIMKSKGDETTEHKVIIHSDDGDCKAKEQKIKVIVEGDEDFEWTNEGEDENVEVYIIKKGDEDVKVIKKKVRIEVEEEKEAGEKAEATETKKKKKK